MLVWAALRAPSREKRLASLTQAEPDWAFLVSLARWHQMVPLLYGCIQEGYIGQPPPTTLEELASETRIHRARAGQLAHDLDRVLRAFDAGNVPAVVLKGLPLSRRLYGDPGLRQASDIDLLVRPQDRESACAILLQHGYRSIAAVRSSRAHDWFVERFGREVSFLHPVRGTKVEVHWHLHQRPDLPVAGAFPGTDEQAGAPTRQLPPAVEALDLLAHGAGHSWKRLKWLADLYRAWECYGVDWNSWHDEVLEAGLGPALTSALLLRSWLLPEARHLPAFPPQREGRGRGALLARWVCRELVRVPAETRRPERRPWRNIAAAAVKLSAFRAPFRRWRLRSGLLGWEDMAVADLPRWSYPLYPMLKPVWWSIRRSGNSTAGRREHARRPDSRGVQQALGNGRPYRLFGLSVASDIDLPLAPSISNGEPDIAIRLAKGLAAHQNRGGRLFAIPAAGWILVRDEGAVLVEPAPGASAEDVVPFLLSSGVGSICWRRGWIPLHATAVRFGDRAILFAGPSGVGKSTLAAACVAAGGELVSDDLSPLYVGAGGEPVLPGAGPRRLKLWPDAAERFALGLQCKGLVQRGIDKLEFAATEGSAEPVRACTLLCLDDGLAAPAEQRLRGVDALETLVSNVYRTPLVEGEAEAKTLEVAASLSRRLCIVRISRPDGLDAVAEVAERLASGWLTK